MLHSLYVLGGNLVCLRQKSDQNHLIPFRFLENQIKLIRLVWFGLVFGFHKFVKFYDLPKYHVLYARTHMVKQTIKTILSN